MSVYDFVIIGAGIVGAAVAYELSKKKPSARIVLLEKAAIPAGQQTGRNSGVIHAGVYYKAGSYKARFCRQGLEDTLAFCRQYNLPYEQCGKLLVATNDNEMPEMHALFARCKDNDLAPQLLSAQQIQQAEPRIASRGGFLVKQTGITDYAAITKRLLSLAATNASVDIRYLHEVESISELSDSVEVTTNTPDGRRRFHSEFLISCAGIYSDKLIQNQGLACDFRVLPFRGEYYRLKSKYDHVSTRLIYPIPDPTMPFLGVHLTKMIGGYTTVGPNAVLATGKEVYQGVVSRQSQWREIFGHQDVWKLIWRYRNAAFKEVLSSLSKAYYARLVSRYCPEITASDLLPYRAGIRAQAVDSAGNLIHDFKFVSTQQTLHVGNAPSPAATAALPIAREVLSRIF